MPDLLQHLQEALSDRYRIERQLGRGGMATVFLAEDLKHHRQVAIKVPSREVAAAIGAERFLREIEIAAKLSHPHILPVHDSGSAGGLLYYVMPYVEGESLRERLEREQRLSLGEALQITREVADALAHAHQRGVIHRDIKPENILLQSGHAVVADFGIARAPHAAGGATLTETGLIVGTPAYMSPEQVSGRGVLDGRSDLYSLGCVFYEMLSGAPPFEADSPLGYAHQHLEGTPRTLAQLRPEVPEGVSRVLARALAKRPEERFADAAEFAQALASPGTLARRAPWQRRGVMAAAAAALVVVVAAGTWWQLRAPGGKGPPTPTKPEWILLAEFEGPADDPDLAGSVRELLRTDIDQSPIIRALPKDQMQLALALAGKPESTRVTEALARELADRNGIGSVVSGQVVRIGQSFSVLLRVVNAESGALVVSLKQSCRNTDALIPTAGKLTRDLLHALQGKRATIAAKHTPIQGMTASFEAFRRYRRGRELAGEFGSSSYREIMGAWADALALDPGFADVWFSMGTTFMNRGEVDSALYAYRKAKALEARLVGPSRFAVDAELAYALGDLPGSVRAYDRLLENYPGDLIALHNQALNFFEWGRLEEAEQFMRRAKEAWPIAPPNTLMSLAFIQASRLHLDDARKTAEQLPEYLRVRANMMIAMAGARWAEAESLATLAAPSPDPEHTRTAEVIFAIVHAMRGSVKKAAGALERAERLAPETPFPQTAWYRKMRVCLESIGETGLPTAAASSHPDSSVAGLVGEGMAQASAGNFSGAEKILGDIRVRTARAPYRHGKGSVLLEAWIARGRGQWRQVVERLAPLCARERGIPDREDSPERPLCRWLVGEAFEHVGRPDSAAAYYEYALSPDSLFGNDPHSRAMFSSFAHQRLVLLYARLGQPEKALAHWKVLAATCTRPDPEVRRMLEEARAAVQAARGMAQPERGRS